jgi:hypothetical protein
VSDGGGGGKGSCSLEHSITGKKNNLTGFNNRTNCGHPRCIYNFILLDAVSFKIKLN